MSKCRLQRLRRDPPEAISRTAAATTHGVGAHTRHDSAVLSEKPIKVEEDSVEEWQMPDLDADETHIMKVEYSWETSGWPWSGVEIAPPAAAQGNERYEESQSTDTSALRVKVEDESSDEEMPDSEEDNSEEETEGVRIMKVEFWWET